MSDNDLEFSIDPYDLLQEHDLMIQRLIKAHNTQGKLLEQMAKQHEDMAKHLLHTNQRIDHIEKLIYRLNEVVENEILNTGR